jgi:hypothetical protein
VSIKKGREKQILQKRAFWGNQSPAGLNPWGTDLLIKRTKNSLDLFKNLDLELAPGDKLL